MPESLGSIKGDYSLHITPSKMTTVTIQLENELERTLKELAEETGMTPDEAARDALKRRLSLFRLRKRQNQLTGVARRAGYDNESDLLDDIS